MPLSMGSQRVRHDLVTEQQGKTGPLSSLCGSLTVSSQVKAFACSGSLPGYPGLGLTAWPPMCSYLPLSLSPLLWPLLGALHAGLRVNFFRLGFTWQGAGVVYIITHLMTPVTWTGSECQTLFCQCPKSCSSH